METDSLFEVFLRWLDSLAWYRGLGGWDLLWWLR